MLRIMDTLAGLVRAGREGHSSRMGDASGEGERDRSAHRARDAGPAVVDAARLPGLRARRLHAERHRLSLRAHGRGGGGVGAAAAPTTATRRSRSIRCSICSGGRARDHTGADFLELVRISARRRQCVRGGGGAVRARLRELHVLRPDRMKVVPGEEGWPEPSDTRWPGKRCASRTSRCAACGPSCTVRLFHPANDHYGMSPIEAAASARRPPQHGGAGTRRCSIIPRGPRAPWCTEVPTAAHDGASSSAAQARALEQGFQGAKRAGAAAAAREGGLDWKPLGLSPKDMDFIEAKNAAARWLFEAWASRGAGRVQAAAERAGARPGDTVAVSAGGEARLRA